MKYDFKQTISYGIKSCMLRTVIITPYYELSRCVFLCSFYLFASVSIFIVIVDMFLSSTSVIITLYVCLLNRVILEIYRRVLATRLIEPFAERSVSST